MSNSFVNIYFVIGKNLNKTESNQFTIIAINKKVANIYRFIDNQREFHE